MSIVKKSIRLYAWKPNYQPVTVVRGESLSRALEIQLFDNSRPVNLTNCQVLFYASKPDGTKIYVDCTASDSEHGLIEVELTEQICAVTGTVGCWIQVTGLDRQDLRFDGLFIEVKDCNLSDAAQGTIESVDDLKAFMEERGKLAAVLHEVNEARIGFPSLKEAMTYEQSRMDEIASEITQDTNQSIGDVMDVVELLEIRVNNLSRLGEGSTTGDAELQDIRISYEGIEYPTAGEAVRAQIDKTFKNDEIQVIEPKHCSFSVVTPSINLFPLSCIEDGRYFVINSAGKPELQVGSDTWAMTTWLPQEENTTYEFKVFDDWSNAEGNSVVYKYGIAVYCFATQSEDSYLGKALCDYEGAWNYDEFLGKRYTTLPNTGYVRIQFSRILVENDRDRYWLSKFEDFENKYSPYEGIFALPFLTENEMKEYVANHQSTFQYSGPHSYTWLDINIGKSAASQLARQINTARAKKMMESTVQISLRFAKVLTQTGGAIGCSDGDSNAVYCVYTEETDDDKSDSFGYKTINLARVGINELGDFTTIQRTFVICDPTLTMIDDVPIVGDCDAPNLVVKGNEIFIFWSCRFSDGNQYECYRIYDCETGKVGTPHRCFLGGKYFSHKSIADESGLIECNETLKMNGTIAQLDGWFYACVCCGTDWRSCVIVKSNNLITWECVSVPNWVNGLESGQICEGAMAEFQGNLYLAVSHFDVDNASDVNPTILAKLDLNGKVLQNVLLPSTTLRPSFFKPSSDKLYCIYPTNGGTNAVCLDVKENLFDSVPCLDLPTRGNQLHIIQNSNGRQYVAFNEGSDNTFVKLSTASNNMFVNENEVLTEIGTLLGY